MYIAYDLYQTTKEVIMGEITKEKLNGIDTEALKQVIQTIHQSPLTQLRIQIIGYPDLAIWLISGIFSFTR